MNIINIINEELGLLNEGLSKILYHFTYTNNLVSILKMDKFATSSNLGSTADRNQDKGKFFFFSTQRSKGMSGYGSRNGTNVCIVLDGEKLSQHLKGSPMDYWGKSKSRDNYQSDVDYKDALASSELEDRIITDKPYIDEAKKYILEIHILIREGFGTKGELKEILEYGKDIRTFFYDDYNSYKLQNKAKTISVEDIKVDDDSNYTYNRNDNSFDVDLAKYLIIDNEDIHYKVLDLLKKYLIEKGWEGEYDKNADDLEKSASRVKYGYGDEYRSLEANIHNGRGNPNPYFRELLKLLIVDMKKRNVNNLKDYIEDKKRWSHIS